MSNALLLLEIACYHVIFSDGIECVCVCVGGGFGQDEGHVSKGGADWLHTRANEEVCADM